MGMGMAIIIIFDNHTVMVTPRLPSKLECPGCFYFFSLFCISGWNFLPSAVCRPPFITRPGGSLDLVTGPSTLTLTLTLKIDADPDPVAD
jgi:hypothetical protein